MADTLPEALENLFRISLISIEIVVINDGSTDQTGDVIETYRKESEKFKNISFQSLEIQNCGRAEAINRGVDICEGIYILFLDADDLIEPNELIKLWSCAQSNRNDLVIGQFKIITDKGIPLSTRSLQHGISKKQLINKIAFSPAAPIHLNAVLINRDLFKKTGGFDKTLIRSQDKDLTLRLLKYVDDFTICDSYHYLYRKHTLTRKQTVQKRFEGIRYRQRMIRKNFSGFTLAASMTVQFCYDICKLLYETVNGYNR